MHGDNQADADAELLASDSTEREHLWSILESFRQYRRAAHHNVTHVRRQDFYALPTAQWSALSQPPISLLDTLSKVDDAIDVNADLAEAILEAGLASFDLEDGLLSEQNRWAGATSKQNLEKARSTIHQMYRDWTVEGKIERDVVHRRVFEDLVSYLPAQQGKHSKLLVPGAGLGRLILASSFILNNTSYARQWTLFPWATTFTNHLSRSDQLRAVTIPDVHPGSTQLNGSMSMTSGDFCEVYGEPRSAGRFSAIITVFFIDTAPNFFQYAKTAYNCLETGGIWINIGPLLWHFEAGRNTSADHTDNNQSARDDSRQEIIGVQPSFELTDEEVKQLLGAHNFKVIHSEEGIGETKPLGRKKESSRCITLLHLIVSVLNDHGSGDNLKVSYNLLASFLGYLQENAAKRLVPISR
ncbi:MAG: hypothetical protein M1828_001235 [Chrysothrix sp. TS-e1954]|nr:MAG: hypothetical protein M1828_001235 [Chrysothrix sp. TS-e1954]